MPAVDPADCATAIALIPDGTISLTGPLSKPLNFSLTPVARRPYRIPAVFHSGTYIVTVDPAWRLLTSAKDRSLENAASLMYFKVWPDVRRGAEEVLKQCLVWKYAFNAGFVGLSWEEGGLHWSFHVFVMPAPQDMPGDGGCSRAIRGRGSKMGGCIGFMRRRGAYRVRLVTRTSVMARLLQGFKEGGISIDRKIST